MEEMERARTRAALAKDLSHAEWHKCMLLAGGDLKKARKLYDSGEVKFICSRDDTL